MNKVLLSSIKAVQKLNKRAHKGSVDSLKQQLEIGVLCDKGREFWRVNKKALGLDAEGLAKAYGYGKSFFSDLISASKVTPDDLDKYIKSLNEEPTMSVAGLLKWMKDAPDKAKAKISFSVAKTETEKGLSVRIDENDVITTKNEASELLEAIAILTKQVKAMNKVKLADVELVELIEA
tara:strand:+ start:1039 stop:1575 length:537 start_codon:yes stop_codon:yes gene_type:complete